MVQNYSDFYEFATEYCPKIMLFKLGKEEVETSTANGEPWDNVIALPVPGVSNAHVAKYGLNGKSQAQTLPGEGPLKSIAYSNSEIVEPPLSQDSSSVADQTSVPAPVEPERNLSDDLELVDRGWYVVQWDDGHLIPNYVCQLVGPKQRSRIHCKQLQKSHEWEECCHRATF